MADTATAMAAAARQAFSPREFRDALGLFASGVAVVTSTTPDGERLGATVSSFSSVSLDPPLILFSIARTSKAYPAWEAAGTFAVNILAEQQDAVSTRFARALTDKWDGEELDVDCNGSPVLRGTLAQLACTSYATYDGGDHLILVGRVDALTLPPVREPRPLLFFRGKYRRLDSEHLIQTPPDASEWLHGW
jgi:flavin reductase (DIM6/NTAB) family NADH-FMN oxidoreductase RutF